MSDLNNINFNEMQRILIEKLKEAGFSPKVEPNNEKEFIREEKEKKDMLILK